MAYQDTQVLPRPKRLETGNVDPVLRLCYLVVGALDKNEHGQAVLLQVRLVDTREGLVNDGQISKVVGLQRGILARGSFTEVVVA